MHRIRPRVAIAAKLLLYLLPLPAVAGEVLNQGTPASVLVGPIGYVSWRGDWVADGNLAGSLQVWLSKNGGKLTARHDQTKPEHDRAGYYRVTLDAEDTSEYGRLDLVIIAGSRTPVRQSSQVMTGREFDRHYSAKVGAADVTANVIEINGNTFTGAHIPADVIRYSGEPVSTTLSGKPEVDIYGIGGTTGPAGNLEDAFDGSTSYTFTGWEIPAVTVVNSGVTVADVGTGAIDTDSFAAGAINSAAVATGAIHSGVIANGAIGAATLANGTLTSAKVHASTYAAIQAEILTGGQPISSNAFGDLTCDLEGTVDGVAGDVTGNVDGSVGSISGVTFPTNFDDLAITASTGLVSAGTVYDKTGYSISGTINTFDALDSALDSSHGASEWTTATGFSTHAAADVWSVGTRQLSGTINDFDELDTAHGAGSWEGAGGLTEAGIADAVWDEPIAGHSTGTTFGGKNQIAVPSATLGDYKATGFSTHAAADVWSVGTRALTDKAGFSLAADQSGVTIGVVTTVEDDVTADLVAIDGTFIASTGTQIADRFDAFFDQSSATFSVATPLANFKATGFSTHAAADVWSVGTRALTDKAGFSLAADQSGVTIGVVTTVEDDVTADLVAIDGTFIASTGTQIADRFDAFFDQSSATFSVATPLANFKATGFSTHAAADAADAVWDEPIAGHSTGTTFGGKNQIGVPSATLGDYKATGFSTHAAADVWSVGTRALTDKVGFSLAADQSGVTIGVVTTVEDDVTADLVAIDGTFIASTGTQIADRFDAFFDQSSATFNVATPLANFKASGFSTHSASDAADAVWDEPIAGHSTGTTFGGKNQIGVPSATLGDYKATGFSTHAAADVWSVGTRALTDKVGFSLAADQSSVIIGTVTNVTNPVTTEDVYHAFIEFLRDSDSSIDRYAVTWFRNGEPVTSGITLAKIQVIKTSDGSDLIAETSLTQVGATGTYKHNESTNRLSAGEVAIMQASATIDGSTRTWRDVLGRDSSL